MNMKNKTDELKEKELPRTFQQITKLLDFFYLI